MGGGGLLIQAMMFDLDGTLVQSEKLKGMSYAIAVQRLRHLPGPDLRAVEAYRGIVGASREEASRHIVERLGLEADLRPLTAQYGVREPWEVLVEMRKDIYAQMVADPDVIRQNQWPHMVALLRIAKDEFCRTALATMSHREEAMRVLRALDLERSLDLVLTVEDVRRPKPDPEIYLLAGKRLKVSPSECLVLEDSPAGVQAGVAAGMNVVAFATPFTAAGLHKARLVKECFVVHSPDELIEVVRRRIAEHNRTGRSPTTRL